MKQTAGLDPDDDTPPFLGLLDVCHPEDKSILSRHMTEPAKDGKDATFEHRIIRRTTDASVRRLHTIIRTHLSPNGKPDRVSAITVDVTDYPRPVA